jgi:hypothetical protein
MSRGFCLDAPEAVHGRADDGGRRARRFATYPSGDIGERVAVLQATRDENCHVVEEVIPLAAYLAAATQEGFDDSAVASEASCDMDALAAVERPPNVVSCVVAPIRRPFSHLAFLE